MRDLVNDEWRLDKLGQGVGEELLSGRRPKTPWRSVFFRPDASGRFVILKLIVRFPIAPCFPNRKLQPSLFFHILVHLVQFGEKAANKKPGI